MHEVLIRFSLRAGSAPTSAISDQDRFQFPLRWLARLRWQRKAVWYSSLFLSCCFPVLLSGCGVVAPEKGLTVTPATINFGSVSLGQSASAAVSLVNGGAAAVQVSQLNMTGQPFVILGVGTLPVTIPAGTSYSVQVQFNPTTAGTATGQMTVATNAVPNSTVAISLSGTGASAIAGSGSSPSAAVSALSCSSSSATGSGTDNCTVTLNTSAATGGFSVSLASNNAAVTVPATVPVPAGASTGAFTANLSAVSSTQSATLTASAGGTTTSFALRLNAAGAVLSANATTVAFGDVALSTPATQTVILTSTGTAPVMVNAAMLAGTGFSASGFTLPATLNPGQMVSLAVQFDPTTLGVATGQLTVTSNSSTGGATVISLNGTGTAAAYQVDLTWDAPASSSDPVAGYKVYRSTGNSTYQLLNSTADNAATYTDGDIQSGATYSYYVESVDARGNQSGPSNIYTATIP